MDGGLLIREVRRRAGLSQRGIASRLGTSQAAVARWEAGSVAPSWAAVLGAIRACGFDLDIAVHEADDHDLTLAEERLRRSPEERLRDLEAFVAFIEMGRAAMGTATAPP